MVRKLPLLLIACCFIFISFSDENQGKKYWYKSSDNNGYIVIESTNKDASTVISTTVNALFDNEKLNFKLNTTCNSNKMVDATKIQFDGTIDSNMNPVVYTGERVKTKKNASYWSFTGDFKNEITNDPEVNKFLEPNHKSVIRMPAQTIPSFNIWAIVPQLPFSKKEGTFKFNSLDETKLYVRKNQTINYLGKFDTAINGANQSLHKFVHQGKKIEPIYYWVNDKRELVKILLDNKFTFTLSSKEAILKNPIKED